MEAISDYFNFIHKYISGNGYFLNINRYEKNSAGKPIRFAEYPYGQDWQAIPSHPDPLQTHVRWLLTKRTKVSEEENLEKYFHDINKLLESHPLLKGPG